MRIEPRSQADEPNVLVAVIPTLHAHEILDRLLWRAREMHRCDVCVAEIECVMVRSEPGFDVVPRIAFAVHGGAEIVGLIPTSTLLKDDEQVVAVRMFSIR